MVWKEYNVIARPIDKRENYIKRCVGIAGDKLEIKNTVLYINDKIAYIPEKLQHSYRVYNNGVGLNNTIRQNSISTKKISKKALALIMPVCIKANYNK